MLIYTIITLAISIPFVWLGIRINRGDLNLIHDYHQKKVKEEEKAAYGKAFSKGMFGMAASMIVSGVVALFGESKSFMIASLVVLFWVLRFQLLFCCGFRRNITVAFSHNQHQ